MDGVIADFSREHKILEEEQGCAIHRPDLHVDYGNLQAIPGAKDALMRLDNVNKPKITSELYDELASAI